MARISEWGNSHGVRLPREVLETAGIAPDADVTITAEPGRISIVPARRKPTLDELLARIGPGERFEEVDYGPPRGREVL
ncbi:MAG: AbrB/MazE/SpoVT family DNA-binding domain-containing protein [Betaproteobacteria bacterium]